MEEDARTRTMSPAGRRWMVAFVAALLVVPTVGLVRGERPAPFSWHMYSGTPGTAAYEVERAGALEGVDLDELVVRRRAEPRSLAGLAAHLCDSDPTVDAVWVERRDLAAMDTVRERRPCAR